MTRSKAFALSLTLALNCFAFAADDFGFVPDPTPTPKPATPDPIAGLKTQNFALRLRLKKLLFSNQNFSAAVARIAQNLSAARRTEALNKARPYMFYSPPSQLDQTQITEPELRAQNGEFDRVCALLNAYNQTLHLQMDAMIQSMPIGAAALRRDPNADILFEMQNQTREMERQTDELRRLRRTLER